MAASIERSIVAALDHLNVSREKQKIILKKEQEMAVKELLDGKDVMAILPTGFGKSLIFTIFAIAKGQISRRDKYRACDFPFEEYHR